MSAQISFLLLLPLGLLSAGCGEEGRADRVEVWEEDGTRVVVNHDPEVALGRWTLEATAEVEIGQVEGEEPYLLQRVIHAHVGEMRRIILLDAGASAIRIYSPEGEHEGTFGRRGQGPGEFQNVFAAHRMAGDTLALTEFPGFRVSFFDNTGGFVRLWTAPALPGPLYHFPEDRYLWVIPQSLPPAADSHRRPASHVVLGSLSGPGADTLAVLPGQELVSMRTESGEHVIQVPFAPGAVHTIDPEGRFIHTDQGFELVFHSILDGRQTRARINREPIPVSESDWRAAVSSDLELYSRLSFATPERRRVRERGFDLAERPSHKPAFERLSVDRDGNVWALSSESTDETDVREWYVFDASGRWITSVLVPSDLHVLDIGSDYLLARWQDELGVQRIRRYGLVKD
jgi:hypothetical protein